VIIGCPFSELDLRHKLRFQPNAVLHFFTGERPLTAFYSGKLSNGRSGALNRVSSAKPHESQSQWAQNVSAVRNWLTNCFISEQWQLSLIENINFSVVAGIIFDFLLDQEHRMMKKVR
jgi:hypothetical protein